MLTWTLPDITFSASNLLLIVVLIELVNEFKLPVDVSIESTLFFKFNVVVAIDELSSPTLLVKDELNIVIVEVIPLVVVATDPLRLLILFETLELNVE